MGVTPGPGDPVPGVDGATVERVLKSDRYAFTAQARLADGTLAVFKRSIVELPPGVRVGAAARRLAAREADHLERLADVHGVPALLARPSPEDFLRQWIEGEPLREFERVPDPVFPALRDVVAAVHEHGVAYADLAKEENIVVEAETDHPWLVDFQISVAKGTPLGALVPYLQAADRFYLARHVKRRRPDQLTDDDRETLARERDILTRLHRKLVKKPYNFVTRRLIRRWSGAGEGRRDGEPRGMRGDD